jgi:tetratricopeptide (TPR) repeat protein
VRREAEIQQLLGPARPPEPDEARIASLEEAVRQAEAGRSRRVAFTARRMLADAYSETGQWDRAFPLFARCLSEHDRYPDDVGPEEDRLLREWYVHIVRSMSEFPDIALSQIQQAFQDVEQRYRAGGHSLREVYGARRWVSQLTGNWVEEQRQHRLWHAAGGPRPGDVRDFEAEVERLVLRGGAALDHVRTIATPALTGELTFDEPVVPIQCLMLVPLVRAGAHDAAALAYRRSRRGLDRGGYRHEYAGLQLEFCALTGNEDAGRRILRERLRSFRTIRRPTGEMEFATAIAVLCRRLIATGRGLASFQAFGNGETTTATALYEEMHGTALRLAASFDARNGSTAQGDRIRARLDAVPLLEFLPLGPTARPRSVPAPVPAGLPPARHAAAARWFQRREDETMARRSLAAVGEPVPDKLAPRVHEVRALLDWDDGSGALLERAAAGYREYADEPRYLECLASLGCWQVEHGQAAGAGVVERTLGQARRLGNHRRIAYHEWYSARAHRAAGREDEAYQALERAARHGTEAGDAHATGTARLAEACWRHRDRLPDEQIARAAEAAKDALLAAAAPEQVVTAYGYLRRAMTDTERFRTLVGRDLAAGVPPRLRGALRYQRGITLVRDGRGAEAVEDLVAAAAEARARDGDTVELTYYLGAAFFAANRTEDAVDELRTVAGTLVRLRDEQRLDDPAMADQARLMLADGYLALGETGPAEQVRPD